MKKRIILVLMLLGTIGYAANRITNVDIAANAAIAFSKLAALTSGNILVGNGSNVATSVAMSGDATLSNTGALTIGTNIVTDAKFRQSAGLSVVGRSANSTGDVADIVAGADFNILRRSGTSIGFGAIDLSQSGAVGATILSLANGGSSKALTAANGGIVYSDADSFEILPAGSAGQVLQSNGAGAPSWVAAGSGTLKTISLSFGDATEPSDCTASPCTIHRQFSSTGSNGFTSVTRSGTGGYTINFTGSFWASAPYCTGTGYASGIPRLITSTTAISTASWVINVRDPTANVDSGAMIICVGN
jgi:hypothetical protein